MKYCHATLAIILLSPSVSGTVHSVEIITSLSFLLYEIHLIIDRKAIPSNFYKAALASAKSGRNLAGAGFGRIVEKRPDFGLAGAAEFGIRCNPSCKL